MIKIGKVGKIIDGRHKDWYIFIENDLEDSGGFLILQSPNYNFKGEGYDDWVEKEQDIRQFIEFNGLVIEWLE